MDQLAATVREILEAPGNLHVTPVSQEESATVFEKVKNFKSEYPEKQANLERGIEAYFEEHRVKPEDLARKERVRDELQKFAIQIFPRCVMVTGGSTATHLATVESDLDVCLFVAEVDGRYAQDRDFTDKILSRFYDALLIRVPPFMDVAQFIARARVPIVKLSCNKEYGEVKVDITCNKLDTMRTNHLIYHYVRFDDRVAKLNLVVKRWATKLGILNSFDGLLSSFSFTMMVIHFLQSVCTPPIVPNLDKLFPSAFERSHVWTLHHNECIDMAIKKSMPENGLSVAELFLGFIAYYASFPWDDMGIDVRHGKRHERNYSLEDEAEFIVIEEPYERYNSARTVCSEYDEYAISQSIKAVARNIFEKGSLEPEVLF